MADLGKIIQKLNHPVLEVRVRSLENIISKIENGIINLEELIHIRELFVYLIDWFKEVTTSQHHNRSSEENRSVSIAQRTTTGGILFVLSYVSKYTVASETLIDLGCVELLSSFKSNFDGSEWKGVIDEILDNFFQCHSLKQYMNSDIDGGSSTFLLANGHGWPPPKKSEKVLLLNNYQTFQDVSNFNMRQSDNVSSKVKSDIPKGVSQMCQDNCETQLTIEAESYELDIPHANGCSNNLFQWIPLTSGDRDILSVTDKRLQSQSSDMIKQSCQFLQIVLFNDFPIEIFIQRPKIFFTLLSLINKYHEKDTEIVRCILFCLIEFTKKLNRRLFKDQRHVQIVDIDKEVESNSMKIMLQKEQLTLLDFSSNIFRSTVSLFRIYIKDDFLFSQLSLLFVLNVRLIPHDYLKNCDKELMCEFTTIFENLGGTLSDFPLQRIQESGSGRHNHNHEVKVHIMAKLLLDMILKSVPGEKLPGIVSSKIVNYYRNFICHSTYVKSFDGLLKDIECLFKFADKNFFCNFVQANSIILSMKCIDKCKLYLSGADTGVNEVDQILDFKCAFKSLSYHCHKDFIKYTIKICCQNYIPGMKESKKWSDLMMNLLFLLKKSVDLAKEVLTAYLDILNSAFSDSLQEHPMSQKYQIAQLLVQKDILREVVTFGSSQSLEITEITKSIISALLLSRLCMSSQMWYSTLSSITSLFPYLLVMLNEINGSHEMLLYSLLEHNDVWTDIDGNKPGLEMTSCYTTILFQMLFAKCSNARKKIFQLVLLKFIERNKVYKTINHDLTNSSFNDIFIFTEQQLRNLSCPKTLNCDLSAQSIEKLWGILLNDMGSSEVRCSAAEQLSFLTDYSDLNCVKLHSYHIFITHEVTRFVKLSEIAYNDKYYFKLILSILKNMVACQISMKSYSLQTDFYFDLLQGAITYFNEENIRYEISCIMAYLLFSDLLHQDDQDMKLSLPRGIHESLNLPIQVSFFDNCQFSYEKELPVDNILWEYVKSSCWKECKWYRDDDVEIQCCQEFLMSKITSNIDISKFIQIIRAEMTASKDLYEMMKCVGQVQLLMFLVDFEDTSEGCLSKSIISFLDDLLSNEFFKSFFLELPNSDNQLCSVISNLWFNILDLNLKPLLQHFNKSLLVEYVVLIDNMKNTAVSSKDSLLLQQYAFQSLTALIEYDNWIDQFQSCLSAESFPAISKIILVLYHSLPLTRTESYYDLPFLEVVLECFMHVSVYKKWSMACSLKFSIQIFKWLSQIIVSFYSDRSIASVSFMGKGIVKKAIISMCHIFHEIKCSYYDTDLFKALFSKHCTEVENSDSSLVWLIPLLSDRSVDIRWGALALSSVLVLEDGIDYLCVSEYQPLPGGIWAVNIQIILDEKESFLVRNQACILLSHLMKPSKDTWSQMVVQDIDSKMELLGLVGFFKLLEHLSFFPRLQDIFLNINESVFCKDISSYNFRTKNLKLLSMNFYSSLLDLILQMMILSPCLIDDSDFFEILETVFRLWSPEQLLNLANKSKFCENENKVFQIQIKIILSINQLISLMYQYKKAIILGFLQKHNLTDKLLSLFSLLKTTYIDSVHLYILIWNSSLTIFLKEEIFQNNDIKLKLFGKLYYICRSCMLITSCKNVQDPVVNKFLKIIYFVLQWTGLKYQKEDLSISKVSPEEKAVTLEMIMQDADVINDNLSDNGLLCLMLIFLRKKVGVTNHLLSTLTLSYIFVIDETTKYVAYRFGLANLVLEEIKCLSINQMSALNMEYCSQNCLVQPHLSCLLILTRNFCAFSDVIKKNMVDMKLISYLKQIWLWTGLTQSLKKNLLQLIIVLSNNCTTALTVIGTKPRKYDEHSFTLLITRYAVKIHEEIDFVNGGKISPCLVLSFSLLGNLVHDSVSRSILIKSKLLRTLEIVLSVTTSANSVQKIFAKKLLNMWLKFVSVLTFYDNGSKAVAKISDLYKILIHILTAGVSQSQRENSLIILRNLMFVPLFKQTISSDNKTLLLLFDILKNESVAMKSLVLSIFWIVLYGNEKKKNILKDLNLQLHSFLNHDTFQNGDNQWLCQSGLKSSKMLQKLFLNY